MASIIKVSERVAGDANGWRATQGEAFTKLLNSNSPLSPDEKERLVVETLSILGDCVDPAAEAAWNTGLVIGYVQSGKTLSFTSLAALARDNGYRVVILLAGTTNTCGDTGVGAAAQERVRGRPVRP